MPDQPQTISVEEANFMVERVKQAYSAMLGQAVSEMAALQLELAKLQAENNGLREAQPDLTK